MIVNKEVAEVVFEILNLTLCYFTRITVIIEVVIQVFKINQERNTIPKLVMFFKKIQGSKTTTSTGKEPVAAKLQ